MPDMPGPNFDISYKNALVSFYQLNGLKSLLDVINRSTSGKDIIIEFQLIKICFKKEWSILVWHLPFHLTEAQKSLPSTPLSLLQYL